MFTQIGFVYAYIYKYTRIIFVVKFDLMIVFSIFYVLNTVQIIYNMKRVKSSKARLLTKSRHLSYFVIQTNIRHAFILYNPKRSRI